MGTCDDWAEFSGELSETKLEIEFKDHQSMCASESGNSYSGRLNMCNGLDIQDRVFNSYNEAEEYITSKFQKWENAIAVKYLINTPIKNNAQISRLKSKRETLTSMLNNLHNQIINEVETKLKSVEFIKCGHCKSRLDTRFRVRTLKCPVCQGSFASKSKANKRQSLELRIEEINKKIQEITKVLQIKADKSNKNRKSNWLIGGLCSS